jgi:hypothetical protein
MLCIYASCANYIIIFDPERTHYYQEHENSLPEKLNMTRAVAAGVDLLIRWILNECITVICLTAEIQAYRES